jgi:hypothetical protein
VDSLVHDTLRALTQNTQTEQETVEHLEEVPRRGQDLGIRKTERGREIRGEDRPGVTRTVHQLT